MRLLLLDRIDATHKRNAVLTHATWADGVLALETELRGWPRLRLLVTVRHDVDLIAVRARNRVVLIEPRFRFDSQ